MQAGAAVAELRVIGHFLRERMLERVLGLRVERRFVQEVRRDQRPQGRGELVFGNRRNVTQYRFGNFLADHRGRLEHLFSPLRKAIDSRGENRLDRSRQRQIRYWTSQLVTPSRAD